MLEKTKNPWRKRGETRANGRRSLDGEFSCVVSGVFSAEMRVCRSNWNSCGCFFDLDSDQAASSIHVANDRNTTGKCWEGLGWLEQLPADTGQVTNSSQGRQIAAAYTDSFYTFFLHNFLRRQDIYSSTTNAILREIWLGLYKAAPIQHYRAQNTSTKKTKKK